LWFLVRVVRTHFARVLRRILRRAWGVLRYGPGEVTPFFPPAIPVR